LEITRKQYKVRKKFLTKGGEALVKNPSKERKRKRRKLADSVRRMEKKT